MNILVLLRLAPDLVEDLEVDKSGTQLDAEFVKLKLNEFDDHALEEALMLKETDGANVGVMAVDGDGIDKVLFTSLAKGADRAVKITGGGNTTGNRGTAAVFAEAVSGQNYDLILTGVQSVADLDGQLGPLVAANLKIPCLTVVTGISIHGSTVIVQKEYSGGVTAEFEVELPAVIGIQAARQPPRYAPVSKIRQIQQSATVEEVAVSAPSSTLDSTVIAMAPPERGAGAKILKDAREILDILKEKGVA